MYNLIKGRSHYQQADDQVFEGPHHHVLKEVVSGRWRPLIQTSVCKSRRLAKIPQVNFLKKAKMWLLTQWHLPPPD